MDVETDIDGGLDPRHRKYASLLLARCLITLFKGPRLRKWVPTYKDIKCRDVLPFFIFVHTSYHVSSGVEQVMYPNFAANRWNHDPFWRKLPLLSETSPPRRKHSHVAILFQHRKPPIFFLGGPTKFPTFRRPSRRVPPFLPTQGVAFCSDLENPKELHRTFRIIGEGEGRSDHQSLIHFHPFRGVLCCTHVGNTIMRFREWMVKRWNPETLKIWLGGWMIGWYINDDTWHTTTWQPGFHINPCLSEFIQQILNKFTALSKHPDGKSNFILSRNSQTKSSKLHH